MAPKLKVAECLRQSNPLHCCNRIANRVSIDSWPHPTRSVRSFSTRVRSWAASFSSTLPVEASNNADCRLAKIHWRPNGINYYDLRKRRRIEIAVGALESQLVLYDQGTTQIELHVREAEAERLTK